MYQRFGNANLTWWFGFRLEPILANNNKNDLELLFTKDESKSLIHLVATPTGRTEIKNIEKWK